MTSTTIIAGIIKTGMADTMTITALLQNLMSHLTEAVTPLFISCQKLSFNIGPSDSS
jgi:hypothetical protein